MDDYFKRTIGSFYNVDRVSFETGWEAAMLHLAQRDGLLERVLGELRAMDRQIEQEWGDGFYEPDPIIGELEAFLRSLGAPKATGQ
jgi:hypothetical protein